MKRVIQFSFKPILYPIIPHIHKSVIIPSIYTTGQWRRQVLKSGGGVISDFKKNRHRKYFENKCEGAERPSPRERSDRPGEGLWEAPSHGREIFQFLVSESCNLVHAVMRFLTLYLIRIWIKIIPYSRTHTKTALN